MAVYLLIMCKTKVMDMHFCFTLSWEPTDMSQYFSCTFLKPKTRKSPKEFGAKCILALRQNIDQNAASLRSIAIDVFVLGCCKLRYFIFTV